MKPMTRHLPGAITDAVDDLTAIHITLAEIQDIPSCSELHLKPVGTAFKAIPGPK